MCLIGRGRGGPPGRGGGGGRGGKPGGFKGGKTVIIEPHRHGKFDFISISIGPEPLPTYIFMFV